MSNNTIPATIKQAIVVNGEVFLIEGDVNLKVTKVIANIAPGDAEEPTHGTIKEGGWGGNPDANTWQIINHQKTNKHLFKIVDNLQKNIATDFPTKETAQNFINWYKTHPFPPVPDVPPDPAHNMIDPNAKTDAQGIVMLYAPKQDGQVITQDMTFQKESSHNSGDRTSLYAKKKYTANSGEITEYFSMNLSKDDEQNAPKLLSGGHTGSGLSDTTRQGRCYAAGINQNGSLHLAKEWPAHPTTPKFYDKIQYKDQNWKKLGNIKNKLVGMKIVYYPVESGNKKGMHIEWWFDKKGLQTQKIENDWQQMAWADDFGDWEGEPLLENQGVKFKGKVLGMYIRIDHIKEPVKFLTAGQHELELPVKRLVTS